MNFSLLPARSEAQSLESRETLDWVTVAGKGSPAVPPGGGRQAGGGKDPQPAVWPRLQNRPGPQGLAAAVNPCRLGVSST